MKAVLISIQPKWCELIANGKKTVEVRKTKPKIETPFKVYIYCTFGGDWLTSVDGVVQKPGTCTIPLKTAKTVCELNGRVIGEFVCDEIIVAECGSYCKIHSQDSQLDVFDLMEYADEKTVFGWHISNLIIYDEPKELSEFFAYCDRCDKRPIACKFAYEESNENGYYSECMCDFKRPIERPPQSWCYVEEMR